MNLLSPLKPPSIEITLVRLHFECYWCGARVDVDRRYGSLKRFLAKLAGNKTVPFLRCRVCRLKRLAIRSTEVVQRWP
jgi:hypothetical protein